MLAEKSYSFLNMSSVIPLVRFFHFSRFKVQQGVSLKVSPCIMCVQYRGGAQYRGGCSVPWGDIMSTVGGYLEYRGGCSVPWGDIMINVGDILSTVGVFSTVGGYHEYRGGLS